MRNHSLFKDYSTRCPDCKKTDQGCKKRIGQIGWDCVTKKLNNPTPAEAFRSLSNNSGAKNSSTSGVDNTNSSPVENQWLQPSKARQAAKEQRLSGPISRSIPKFKALEGFSVGEPPSAFQNTEDSANESSTVDLLGSACLGAEPLVENSDLASKAESTVENLSQSDQIDQIDSVPQVDADADVDMEDNANDKNNANNDMNKSLFDLSDSDVTSGSSDSDVKSVINRTNLKGPILEQIMDYSDPDF